ncbi:dipeptidase [Candidatus Gracilibacteria bacterium]|nr:dipeptidase [Candidatus Gracilibacteria bacterium]
MPAWTSYLETSQDRFHTELLDFLRIPSVSSLPEHSGDVQQAAAWVAARLRSAGIETVEILPTAGHPVVYGEWLGAPGKPIVMIYGHFDVQPVDPIELWTHPPFAPHVKDGRVYARGASDDKGNMLVPILAVEALLQSTGALPVNIKFFFEGQEEIGSPQIEELVATHKEKFACDLVLSADGGQWSETQPETLVSLRGGCAVQVDVVAANRDMHSGLYGGVVHNPIHALTAILSSMRSADGVIQVAGFYDEVVPLTAEDRAAIARVPFEAAKLSDDLAVTADFGEAGYTPLERNWRRPTLEVNGIWGGFQGEGIKTVLPAQAHAKITCRLVANQDPDTIARLIAEHVAHNTPPGVRASVSRIPFVAYPYMMPADHPGNVAARAVLSEMYGCEPYIVGSGGSIPVCSTFLRHLGVYTTNFGFAISDENFHAPDEFYRLSSFVKGQHAYCKLLERLAL